MKKLLILFTILFLLPFVSAQSCLTSSEDFATEVVVSDYNLFNLNKITTPENNQYIFPSEFNADILTIIQETAIPQGISVRIQIPTSSISITEPNLRFVSTSAEGELKKLNTNNFRLWQVSCEESSCIFEKEGRKLTVNEQLNEVTVEIREELGSCTQECSGVCIAATTEAKCVDARMRNDFNTILQGFSITNDFEDLLSSYRIIGSEEIIIADIQPTISPYINWQEALRQELVFLDSKEIIDLSREDIESIASLAKKGQAGQNYRIVKEYQNDQWMYYDKTNDPVLTNIRDCTEYANIEPKQIVIEEETQSPNTFYLIPFILIVTGVLLLVILVIIGRVIRPKSEKTFTKDHELKL